MKADSTDKAEPASKSAQDGNRMQGEKSKSMQLRGFRRKDWAKGSKEMKARGPRRQDRRHPHQGRGLDRQQGSDDGQRRDFSDCRTAG